MRDPAPTATVKQIQRDGRIVKRLSKPVCRLVLPDRVVVDDERPLILAGNHRSLYDVFCSAAACANAGASARFLVQERYFSQFGIGRWLRRIGCIPLSRANKDEAFAEAAASLARGEVVGIMPEGRLTPPEERDPQVGVARPGVSELAAATNALVSPIVFHNTDVVWPRNGWPRAPLPRPTVTLEVGPAMELTGNDHVANAARVMAEVTAMMNRLDAINPR